MSSVTGKSRLHPPHRVDPCGACKVRDISACALLDSGERDRLTSIMQTTMLPAHRLIFTEGEPARHVFTVTDGVVKIYKLLADGRRQITGFLFPGDFLGLIHSESYAYTAETVTEVRLCQFPRARLESLFDELPNLELQLLDMASHELVAAQDQMVLLGRKSARERVASFLLMLSMAARRQGNPGNPVFIPIPRADIADYLGLTVETVSRIMTRFGLQRLIQVIDDRHVHLVDPATLCRIAIGTWNRTGSL
jgi:CRP/FNR family transcriptional regulator